MVSDNRLVENKTSRRQEQRGREFFKGVDAMLQASSMNIQ